MTTDDRIESFLWLSNDIKCNLNSPHYQNIIAEAEKKNSWFEKSQTQTAIFNLTYLIDSVNQEPILQNSHSLSSDTEILIVCAGNIPSVAFHDVMCVILSGAKAIIKLSSNDNVIIPFLLNRLTTQFPYLKKQIEIINTPFSAKYSEYNGVIATGSNSSSLVFEQYFRNIPHIIRKSRYSCGIILPNDTIDGLEDDICLYFGQGCRSISHLFVPKCYDFSAIIEKLQKYSHFAFHNRYRNNLDYQKAIMIMNNIAFIDANAVLLRQSSDLYSPIGVLNYSFYDNPKAVQSVIEQKKDNLQCIAVSNMSNMVLRTKSNSPNISNNVLFGQTQKPKFTDYADGVNTLQWLYSI